MPFPPFRGAARAALLLPALLAVLPAAAAEPKPLEFHVTFDRTLLDQPFSGRVYVMLSRTESKTLRGEPNWFRPEPLFATDVKDWKPGAALVIGNDALGYPTTLAKLPRGRYSVQVVMDLDQGDRHFSTAEGNLYGTLPLNDLDPETTGPVAVKLDRVYHAPALKDRETERVKYVEIESKLLTKFHGRPTMLQAGVVLPKSYAEQPKATYPVVYEIPGFGGDATMARQIEQRNGTDVGGVEMLWVVLDGNCRTGHDVFADSDNNGPCGQALIEELIPHIEKNFRAVGTPQARFVTGHSSGGWSSLWLQVTYPDFFNGVWSTSPDPVDFRNFQNINLYDRTSNMFLDFDGKPRPLARDGGKVLVNYKPFSDLEAVMGHGGQLGSFEAVFSQRGPDGKPRQLWDRTTGAIDPETVKHWEKYDIRLQLERNWKTLGPKLAGKLHVYMGDADTFYLEGAVLLLKESQKRLGSDAVIEIFPGKTHFSVVDTVLRKRMDREMAERNGK